MKDAMNDFLKERAFCVISTVNASGAPESAMVGFTQTKTFDIIIGTSTQSRKYANLIQNPDVAVVVGDGGGTVQLEGSAELLADDTYAAMVESGEITAIPGIDLYRKDPNQVFIKIVPSWIRFVKTGESGGKEEFTEF